MEKGGIGGAVLRGTAGYSGLAHEDGYECHTFHESGKNNGDNEHLREGAGVATGGLSGLHTDKTDAETGTENGESGLERSQVGTCNSVSDCFEHNV